MTDAYFEMKGVPEMKGSLNNVISAQRKMYRPPSLSESFAWTEENILRASNTSLDLLVSAPQKSPIPSESPKRCCIPMEKLVNNALRFVFHITLISIFESVFFFMYISKLEDNGINKTVGTFINDAVNACSNLTDSQRIITNDILTLFLNGTEIIADGNTAQHSRSIINKALFTRAWIYVGSLGALFAFLTMGALYSKIRIKWVKLLWENLLLVSILAIYEYTFFSTIIFPYDPITGAEIARNAVYELQAECGLLSTIK
jgi:hypothetical protein